MNIIEKLGGYKDTKKHLDSCWCDNDNKVYLLEKLLEYRRQHNIFEEGDWVVIPSRGNELFQVSRLLCRSDIQEMIHATDDEIKAGKRLSTV